MPRYLQNQKKWYLQNKDKFERYRGKWIGLRDNEVVAEANDDGTLLRLLEAYEKKFPNQRKALIVPVGIGDLENEVLPIDVRLHLGEHVLTTGDSGSLTFASVAHPKEYELDSLFVTCGRFQQQPPLYNQYFFQRPVLSTLMETKESKKPKVISFVVDPGSPLSFLCARSLLELELLSDSNSWHFDLYEKQCTLANLWGLPRPWRASRDHFNEINILGCNIINQCKVELDYKNKIVNVTPNKQDL